MSTERIGASIALRAEDVHFAQATDGELNKVWALNASVWAEPLSMQHHIFRERELSRQPATTDKWSTWILRLRKHPKEIVSSVETMEKAVIVHNSSGSHLKKAYGIASVFTNPAYRGNGMATILVERLKQWLDGEGDARLSVLYSDIGSVSRSTHNGR